MPAVLSFSQPRPVDGGGLGWVGRVRRPHARCGAPAYGVADVLRVPGLRRFDLGAASAFDGVVDPTGSPTEEETCCCFLRDVVSRCRFSLAQGEGPRRAMPRASRPRTRRRGYRRHRDPRGWDDSRPASVMSRRWGGAARDGRKPDGKAKRQTKGRADFPCDEIRFGRGFLLRAVVMPPRRRPRAPARPTPARRRTRVSHPRPRARSHGRGCRWSSSGLGARRGWYHALSLADPLGADVDVVAYGKRTPPRGRRSSQHPHGPHPAPPAWTNASRAPNRASPPSASRRRRRRCVDHRGGASETDARAAADAAVRSLLRRVLARVPHPTRQVRHRLAQLRVHTHGAQVWAVSPTVFIAKVYERMLGRLGHATRRHRRDGDVA